MRVTQVLCAAGPVDAVTNQALAYRSLFRRWGWTGEDYAPVQAHDMDRGTIKPLHELRPAPGEPLVVHYSGYANGLERLLAACPRSLLVSHNITPPQYFWSVDPAEAVRCQLGYGQLGELARAAARLVGVSSFNAAELRELSGREAEVIPVLFDRRALGAAGSRLDRGSGSASGSILFVGRLVPHKRQDLVIRAFARLRRLRRPEARLVLVGVPLSLEYGAWLARLAQELAPGAVSFETGLASTELWERYRSATAFLCLSEHEGFCIPLLEAFHFRVPVIARDAGAVGEVVGDAGVLLSGEDGVATISELLAIVLGDPELRTELAERGERRLDLYDHDRVAARVRGAVTALAAA